jgi:hypothetical protein
MPVLAATGDASGLKRLNSTELQELYQLIDEIRSEELKFANCTRPVRPRAALTRMRTRLSKAANLCKAVRKDLLDTREHHTELAEEYWAVRRPEIEAEKEEAERRRAEGAFGSQRRRYHGSW